MDSFAYAYDATWKDKLTSYDGKAITHDEVGNPTEYDGWTYTWETGRQLKQMSNETVNVQFKYNAFGLRTQKTVGAVTTKYYWAGEKITHLTKGANILHFWNDAAGQPVMVTYNDANYYYLYNTQGDVIGILDATTGAQVVSYAYDSWGKPFVPTGTLASTLGAINPFRYRGYIYDEETGLYYLQSRYYDPEISRMLNADSVEVIASQNEILGVNLFLYCKNDPINNTDGNGSWALPNWAKIVIGVVAVAAAVSITVATGGAAAPLLVGVAVSTLSGAAIGYATTGTAQGAIDGACDGFMWGGICAFGSAAGTVIKGAQAAKAASNLNRITGTPNKIGRIGEKLSGVTKNTKSISINGRTRIPDGLSDTVLQEVKNVKRLSYTTQLKDSMEFAKTTGRAMELYVRPNTYMTKPLQDAIREYSVITRYLWR